LVLSRLSMSIYLSVDAGSITGSIPVPQYVASAANLQSDGTFHMYTCLRESVHNDIFGTEEVLSGPDSEEAGICDSLTSIDARGTLVDCNDARRSVQEVVQLCRPYQGREPHWLWGWPAVDDQDWTGRIIENCLRLIYEATLFDLLRALVDDDPSLPAIAHEYGGSFLYVAHRYPYARDVVSTRALLLLAVPGANRGPREGSSRPLHCACAATGMFFTASIPVSSTASSISILTSSAFVTA
jgi:hypothetical protein